MVDPRTDDPVIARFRAALDSAFGKRIERVVLYGSRARGDAGSDSDYDVAAIADYMVGECRRNLGARLISRHFTRRGH
jgi:predicted nucleotidyltransferase